MESQNNARWWETYLVRYITGSVVGAVIVYVILKKSGIDLIPCLDDIKSSSLLVLSALGFAYCYLVSAPITLLHATRSLFGKPDGPGVSLFISCALATLVAICFAWLAQATYLSLWGLGVFAGILLSYVYYRAVNSYKKVKHEDQWRIWYSRLAISRENGSKEFIESYRHLREHGNAFFIVLLEISWAIPLFMIVSLSAEMEMEMEIKITLMLCVTIVWLSTGMACWILGNYLEQYLIDTPSLQTEQQDPQGKKYRNPNIRHCPHRR